MNIRYKLEYLKALYRVMLGFCPLCNSDAPELYDCPICNGRHSARGDKFPPPKATKSLWLKDYKAVLSAKEMIGETLKEYHKNKKATS